MIKPQRDSGVYAGSNRSRCRWGGEKGPEELLLQS
eukprot:COSAG03_NODE_6283_length_1084_cov_1.196954_2_plen_34_part_01